MRTLGLDAEVGRGQGAGRGRMAWRAGGVRRRVIRGVVRAAVVLALPALFCALLAFGQTAEGQGSGARPAQGTVQGSAQASRPGMAPGPVVSDKDLLATQEELIRLLKLSPTLTTVVARDPTLLADQEYVRRNNPQLAQFLANHPEVGLNPDFYLFTHLHGEPGHQDEALERKIWPELTQPYREEPVLERLMGDVVPFFVFVSIAGALMWLVRVLLENRRWSRIFKLQTEVHGKLIEKFGSSQELMSYMQTDAGRRFLEAAPIPVNFEADERVPSAVARVLTPLQIGIVMSLLGLGFLSLRKAHVDLDVPMLVLGTMIVMPGIGFILSAGVTWLLAGRLGMATRQESRSGGTDSREGL